ncbi:putative copper-transporting ATPase [Viridothelium virens]|uniref:Putative copper-transporting ATPase n=1 Tax=Viridothelium virens TaxID=1048519 RepID=A0A6A6HLN6_VIRVR|nr:putative copper-transporting ATPase [Viridothelium virens]
MKRGNDENTYKDGCCLGEDEAAPKDDCQDACCSGNKDTTEKACKDECCSGENAKSNGDGRACCEGKSTPCCDSSCVDRIASRECESDCGEKAYGRDSRAKGTACAAHKHRTREKYAAKLAALECICQALIALGQESCCIAKGQPPTRIGRESRRSLGRAASSDCCNEPCPRSFSTAANNQHSTRAKNQDSSGTRECCGPASSSSHDSRARATGLAMEQSSGINKSINVIRSQGGCADVEKGALGNEHIALSITGMTCTGCETKLQRVLGTLPPISNVKTSLIMARAEFNLDIASMSPESVMKHLERTTEFKCERILTQGSYIDVIPSNVKDFLDRSPPFGVKDMLPVGSDAVCINFDPNIIGARSLINKSGRYSCQLAPLPTDPGLAAGSKHVHNLGYTTLLSVVLTIPVLILAWAPIEDRPIAYGAVSLALATIIQVAIAGPFYPRALKSLIFSRMIEMDLLIVLSTSAAYIFSVISFGYLVSGTPLSTGEFFATSTLLVTLIMVGRWIAALSRQKAVESISIRSLQSSTAQLVTQDGAVIEEIDARLLQYGDLFSVLPEHRVPTDGIVLSGDSEIDESMLTGESRLREKHMGSKVVAGSINGSGKLIVQLTHLPGENTISVIAGMVDSAKLSKPKIQDFADRVASYFVPTIIVLTIVTFIVWIGIGIAIQNKSSPDAAIQAITYAITVLIVSCPCAIGLAVPMVIVISSGVAAERGIIFKAAASMEMASKATHVVFDKTGTLTVGKLKVVNEKLFAQNNPTQRSMVLGLVVNSKHPVSAAVAGHYAELDIRAANVERIRVVTGKGIEGEVDGKVIRGGNARWLNVESDELVQHILSEGRTVFCVTLDSELFAIYGLSDTVRPEAAGTIAKLKESGIQVSLLSGDDAGAVQCIASQIGLNPDEARSRCSPSDKQAYIQDLLAVSVGTKKAIVVFVGDGTNDALALTQATMGMHMSTGTDVAESAADVVLVRPSLEGVLTAINVSHAAVRRIGFNFAWSFVYNILALLFASGALISAHRGRAIKIPPQYAGLGELISVLPVIATAVGLKWAKL